MKRLRTLVELLMITAIGLSAIPDRAHTARQDDGKELGFPFEILFERFTSGVGPPLWQASIEMPKARYSRKNLDRLFRFCSLRHPNMAERLTVYVYTGRLTPKQVNKPPQDSAVNKPPQDSEVAQWDALFFREGDGIGSAGRNESYIYRPDLDKPKEMDVIILKGTLINRSKKIVETWETSNGDMKVRVLAYYLEGVDPPGVYYTFQSFDADWSEWHSIMTVRQDERVPIPTGSVVFVSDTTAYTLMGSMYAVTTDSGKRWSAWDAERDFEMGRWCDHWLMSQVEIAPNGGGTMSLTPIAQLSKVSVLRTSDFGRHWNSQE